MAGPQSQSPVRNDGKDDLQKRIGFPISEAERIDKTREVSSQSMCKKEEDSIDLQNI